jgi:CRISPR-associated endonuclease Cas1
MAASHNLSQFPSCGKSAISKSGVLTIHGFGVRVRLQSGHLEIEDGIGLDRRKIRLARVGHGLRRLVCISEDGFTTLGALKWLADIGASFVMLNRNGTILFVTGPAAPSDARLRRAQALAFGNPIGLEISRKLIDAKLGAQARVAAGALDDPTTAREIEVLRSNLVRAEIVETLRLLEANAAAAYFAAWRDIPVLWPRAEARRVPDHWRSVGSRRSPLSGGPRLAITPVHAILNFCFALLESETRLALAAMGLDVGLGLGLHTDTPNRDSLAFDVLEPIRPEIEDWVLNWVRQEPLRRSDFFETSSGNCRLMPPLCVKLSETAPVWGKRVAPWAEYVASTLWASTSPAKSERKLSTPLTQQHRRIAKGRPSFVEVKIPKPERLCRGCGKKLERDSIHCKKCDVAIATKRIVQAGHAGRIAGHTPEAIAKESATHLKHAIARAAWHPEMQPVWLTKEAFEATIQPALVRVSATLIAERIGVSRQYAACVREGYRPHPRHWLALARLVGVSIEEEHS